MKHLFTSRFPMWSSCLLLVAMGCTQAAPKETETPSSPQLTNAPENDTPAIREPEQLRDASAEALIKDVASQQVESSEELAVQTIYRPSKPPPAYDPELAIRRGIRRYETAHFELWTDIDPEKAQMILPLVDQVYTRWVGYFGELPPDREGRDFQITGYVMSDAQLFKESGMLPEDLPLIQFGKHRGHEFWAYDQEFDYYLRHLIIHEATHCFMTILPGAYPPLWYLEGMAEFFGTHAIDAEGQMVFGVFPHQPERFIGLSRIDVIQREIDQGRFHSLQQVLALNDVDFSKSRLFPYAWSWALCYFLESHPRYQERFRDLGQHRDGRAFVRQLAHIFQEDQLLLTAEWEDFCHRLEYGYDVPRNAFVLREPQTLPDWGKLEFSVAANQGWQSTGLMIDPQQPLFIQANGEVQLAVTSRPWISQPQGISVEYAAGFPIGQLLAGIVAVENSDDAEDASRFHVLPIGREAVLTAQQKGLLFLRVNDAGNAVADNEGTYEVTISAVEADSE